jgi:amino acid transporter
MSHSQSSPPPAAAGTAAEATTLGGSGRKLTLVDAVAQSVGFMGPVFSMAFLVPLIVGINATQKGAGAAAPLSVLVAAVGVLALSWLVAQYAKKIQAAGSLYDYVTDGLGTRAGAAAGFLYYLGIIGLGGGLLVMIGGTIHDTLFAEFKWDTIPNTGWDLILLALVCFILYFGVGLSTRAQLALAMFSIFVVLVFCAYVVIKVGGDNSLSTAFSPSSSPDGLSGVLFGVLYGVLLFTGFETAANLGEETAHPKRDIPRAVITAVVVIGAFYLFVTYAQIAGYRFSVDALGKNFLAPLFGLAAPAEAGGYGGVGIARLLELVVILDMLAVLIGISVAGSRGVFAMSRDHRFPAGLGKVSQRGTPLRASIVVVVIFALFIIATRQFIHLFQLPATPHYIAMFAWFSAFGGFALVVIYFLMTLGAIRGLKDHQNKVLLFLTILVSLAVTGGAIFGAWYLVPEPTVWTVYAALGLLVLGFILSFVFPGKQTAHTSFDELAESEAGPVKL